MLNQIEDKKLYLDEKFRINWLSEELDIKVEHINVALNENNFKNYKNKFFKEFGEYPSHLALLSYDLVGLVYYLSLKNNLSNLNKLFKAVTAKLTGYLTLKILRFLNPNNSFFLKLYFD